MLAQRSLNFVAASYLLLLGGATSAHAAGISAFCYDTLASPFGTPTAGSVPIVKFRALYSPNPFGGRPVLSVRTLAIRDVKITGNPAAEVDYASMLLQVNEDAVRYRVPIMLPSRPGAPVFRIFLDIGKGYEGSMISRELPGAGGYLLSRALNCKISRI